MKHDKILKKISLILLSFTLMTSFVSCEDDDLSPDPSGILVDDIRGDYYVQLLLDGEDVYHLGYYLFNIYNTGDNSDTQIWLDDHGLWPTFVKANVDLNGLTLSGTELENEYCYTSGGVTICPKVTITNGKIYKNVVVAPSGTVTDSISFNVEYSDDPGTIYQIAGYKSTAKQEDLH